MEVDHLLENEKKDHHEERSLRNKTCQIIIVISVAVVMVIALVLGLYYTYLASTCVKNELYSYRLPESTKPKHYALSLKMLDGETQPLTKLEGEVSIDIDILEDTNCIVLHSAKIEIIKVIFLYEHDDHGHGGHDHRRDEDEIEMEPKKITYDEEHQFMYLRFKEKLTAGNEGTLKIFYNAEIPNNTVYDNHAFYSVTKNLLLFFFFLKKQIK